MTCDGCVKAVSDSLFKLGGITKVDADLAGQLVSVEGTGALLLRLLGGIPPEAFHRVGVSLDAG